MIPRKGGTVFIKGKTRIREIICPQKPINIPTQSIHTST